MTPRPVTIRLRAVSQAIEALSGLKARHEADLPLAETLLALALEEYPELEPEPYIERLDGLAGRVRALTGRVGELAAARQALFEEAGFEGNTEAYYDPQNSLLNVVMDRRRGLPITLAAIYVEVVRRAGGRAYGVGFPGHFLAAHEIAGRSVFVDPFRGGQVQGPEALEAMLSEAAGVPAKLEPWMTEPNDGLAVAVRVLTNLQHAYLLAEDRVGAVTALDRLLALAPERVDARRDRGLLYAQLRLPQAALPELEAYVAACPTASDTPRILALLPQLQAEAKLLD